jgi:hypothetical protein
MLIWIHIKTSDVFRKLPDDDPNMDRNMKQTLNKANVSKVILDWFCMKNVLC